MKNESLRRAQDWPFPQRPDMRPGAALPCREAATPDRRSTLERMTDRANPNPASPSPAPLPISATVICKNEEACIGKCLSSLKGLAEIVVVDSGSTDGTLAIVEDLSRRGLPIRLIHQPWLGYARQKQFALDQASSPWVLSIDADEWLDDDLRTELPRLIGAEDLIAGWQLRRTLTLYGRPAPVSLSDSPGKHVAPRPARARPLRRRPYCPRRTSSPMARPPSHQGDFCATSAGCRSTSR